MIAWKLQETVRLRTNSFSVTRSKPERTNWLTNKFNYPKLSYISSIRVNTDYFAYQHWREEHKLLGNTVLVQILALSFLIWVTLARYLIFCISVSSPVNCHNNILPFLVLLWGFNGIFVSCLKWYLAHTKHSIILLNKYIISASPTMSLE